MAMEIHNFPICVIQNKIWSIHPLILQLYANFSSCHSCRSVWVPCSSSSDVFVATDAIPCYWAFYFQSSGHLFYVTWLGSVHSVRIGFRSYKLLC